MDILFLADNYPPETNAAALRVHERAVHWVRQGHRVTVITSAPNFPDGDVYPGYRNRWLHREVIDGIRVLRVKTYMAPNRGVYRRIADFMSFMASASVVGVFQPRPDVVVATSPQFFSAVGGYLVARAKRRPFVFELSDLWPASIRAVGAMQNRRVLRAVEKLELGMYRRAQSIVALTHAFRDDLTSRGIDGDKIRVVQNGANLDDLTPAPADPRLRHALGLEGKFVVAYIGTQGMAHALHRVVESAAHLRHEADIRFLFVGAGACHRQLVELTAESKLENVVFVERKPRAEVADYWRLADVALVHLKDDPVFATVLPSKIFEAMAMGRAILFSGPAGEASRLLEEEGAGLICPPENSHALAEAVLRLRDDTKLRGRLADASYVSSANHTRSRQAEDFLAVLEQVAGLPSKQPGKAVVRVPDASHSSIGVGD